MVRLITDFTGLEGHGQRRCFQLMWIRQDGIHGAQKPLKIPRENAAECVAFCVPCEPA
jgi:hypothetical protein